MKTKLMFFALFGTLPVIVLAAGTMIVASSQYPSTQAIIPYKTLVDNSSSQELDQDKTLSPYFFVKSNNPDLDQLPLKATSAEVNIAGVIADVSVVQEYANEGKNPIEAIYVFPASTRAAVYSMKMTIGERTIIRGSQTTRQKRFVAGTGTTQCFPDECGEYYARRSYPCRTKIYRIADSRKWGV